MIKTKKNKKMFVMKKKATKSTKVAKIKKVLNNKYVEAALTGVVGAAAYVITTHICEKAFNKSAVEAVESEVETKDVKKTCGVGISEKSVKQRFAYTFAKYGDVDIYVCPKFTQPLTNDQLTELQALCDAGNEEALIEAIRGIPTMCGLYTG